MKLSFTLAVLFVVLSIVSHIESAKLRSTTGDNCFDQICSGALNKCCKKFNEGGKFFSGKCVKNTDECPTGWEKAKK